MCSVYVHNQITAMRMDYAGLILGLAFLLR